MPDMKPAPAFALFDNGRLLHGHKRKDNHRYEVFDGREAAEKEGGFGETVAPVMIVGREEWKRMKAIEKAATEMLDELDNSLSADDWSTSDLREALARRLKGAGG